MLKSKIIDELNESCDYRNCTQDSYYFHKWTENDIDFENNKKRRYCVKIKDGEPDDLYLCMSCRSIINKYEYEYENICPTSPQLRHQEEKCRYWREYSRNQGQHP